MNIKVTRHVGWFLLPTLQWQPTIQFMDIELGWSLVLWWGQVGLVFERRSASATESRNG